MSLVGPKIPSPLPWPCSGIGWERLWHERGRRPQRAAAGGRTMAFLGAEHPHDCYTDTWSATLLPTVTAAVAWPLVFSWVIYVIVALLTSSLNRLPMPTPSTYILESGTSTPKRGHGLHGTTSIQRHSHRPAGIPSFPQVRTELLLCFQSSPIECAEEDTAPPHSLLAAESLWNSLQILKTSRLRNLCKETFMR